MTQAFEKDADTALLRAWNLGSGQGGWSDTVMTEAEVLLPILVAAGYAFQTGHGISLPRESRAPESWKE